MASPTRGVLPVGRHGVRPDRAGKLLGDRDQQPPGAQQGRALIDRQRLAHLGRHGIDQEAQAVADRPDDVVAAEHLRSGIRQPERLVAQVIEVNGRSDARGGSVRRVLAARAALRGRVSAGRSRVERGFRDGVGATGGDGCAVAALGVGDAVPGSSASGSSSAASGSPTLSTRSPRSRPSIAAP